MQLIAKLIAASFLLLNCSAQIEQKRSIDSKASQDIEEHADWFPVKPKDPPPIDEEGEGQLGYLTDIVGSIHYTTNEDGSVDFKAPAGTVAALDGKQLPKWIFVGRTERWSFLATVVNGGVHAAARMLDTREIEVAADGSFSGKIAEYDSGSLVFFLNREAAMRRTIAEGPDRPDTPQIAFRATPRRTQTHNFRPSINLENLRRLSDGAWLVTCKTGFVTPTGTRSGRVSTIELFTRRACVQGE